MFRKDEATIREWSEQNVEKCWQLQREIVDDAWACLNPGGLLIYSTCTFNTKENEENIRYFLEQYDDMEVVPVDIKPEWHITGSLLGRGNVPQRRGYHPRVESAECREVLAVAARHCQRRMGLSERRRSINI